MAVLKQLAVKCIREIADRIEVGTSEVTESQAIDILRVVAHEAMSKVQACSYLNMSPSRFDDHIRAKEIPKGRKEVGFKELKWYKDELDVAINKIKRKK